MKLITPRTRDNDIFIRIAPALADLTTPGTTPTPQTRRGAVARAFGSSTPTPGSYSIGGQARTYQARVYTRLPLPAWPINPTLPSATGADDLTGLPLRFVEQVSVRWDRYQDYLALFMDGSKDSSMMRARLFEALSPGLEYLFGGAPLVPAPGPVRVWWSCETPELEDLPWEFLAYGPNSPAQRLTFVRGQPPLPDPVLPISGPLRIAAISGQPPPSWWHSVLDGLGPNYQVKHFPNLPRAALQEAIAQGYEVIHLACDAIVSLAYEGILYLSGTTSPELSASEFSDMLRGSRVRLLSLTENADMNPDMVPIGRYNVRSAYRGFAYFARSPLPLPSTLSTLGPQPDFIVGQFWHTFYQQLAATLDVEQAITATRSINPWENPAIALFLRQGGRRTFQRSDVQSLDVVDPAQLNSDLQQSRAIVGQFEALQAKLGDLPDSVKKFLADETQRQTDLETSLDPFMDEGGTAS